MSPTPREKHKYELFLQLDAILMEIAFTLQSQLHHVLLHFYDYLDTKPYQFLLELQTHPKSQIDGLLVTSP